jgi:hypothetical protein
MSSFYLFLTGAFPFEPSLTCPVSCGGSNHILFATTISDTTFWYTVLDQAAYVLFICAAYSEEQSSEVEAFYDRLFHFRSDIQ